MPDCCRCNGLGTCRRCSCAKAGRLCENCLPGRRGLCVNQPTLSTIVSDTPPVSLPAGQSENEPRATCTVAEPQLSSSPVPTTISTSQPIHQESPIQPVVLQPTITLPVSPSNEASFTLPNPLTPIRATVFLTPTDETLTADSSFSSVPSIPAPSITPVLGVDSSPAPSITPALGIDNFDLPPFIPIDIAKAFTWGSTDGFSFAKDIDAAYDIVVRWKRNLFKVPYGNIGKKFVSELARLFREYANSSALEAVALKAAMTMPSLLLQKPHNKSKEKENSACLERRLSLWLEGDISALLKEGQSIQDRLKHPLPVNSENDRRAQTFGKLVMQGKVRDAIRLLSDSSSSGVLLSTDKCQATGQSVRDVLAAKHPPGQEVVPTEVFSSTIFSDSPHPVIFDALTGALIKSIAMSSSGAAGPSGAEAADWRRYCSCFKRSSDDLCTSLAAVAKKLCILKLSIQLVFVLWWQAD